MGEEFDLTIADSPDEATVPDSVIDALEADLTHFRPPCQQVLECCSSWGCLALVHRVSRGPPSGKVVLSSPSKRDLQN